MACFIQHMSNVYGKPAKVNEITFSWQIDGKALYQKVDVATFNIGI